jgi:hypothetical protein
MNAMNAMNASFRSAAAVGHPPADFTPPAGPSPAHRSAASASDVPPAGGSFDSFATADEASWPSDEDLPILHPPGLPLP